MLEKGLVVKDGLNLKVAILNKWNLTSVNP
jgi:hypothetical protein